ncbi:exported hypothetical protein [metagenome]|uniref:Uncharacterized protein n=1 Tax=metagenome TaxID=256318 RepID=A0A2P2BZ15_9ZZZZ
MTKRASSCAPWRLVAATILLLGACSADPPADEVAATPNASSTPESAPGSEPVDEQAEVVRLPVGEGWLTLSEGRYAAWGIGATLRYEVDLPEGWRALSGTYLNAPEDGHGILFVARVPKRITMLPRDPCRDHSLWLVGPTVDDLARAMARQPVWKVSTPRHVTLAGVPATYLEVVLPASVDPADCVGQGVSEYEAGPDGMITTQSYRSRWWILEVHHQRFLVMARCYDTCTKRDVETMTTIAESITFLPRR